MGTTNQNRLWWRWRFAAPAAVVFVTIISSVVMLGEIQEQSGERLYALFAHTDSAGTGEIFWKKNGQAQAYATVELPYYIGLTFAVVATAVGTVGVKQNAGWLGLVCLWIYGFMCVLVLSAVYVWLWINVNGVFI